jgi:tetraacyldisaccharide 4'-kinase
VIIRANPSRLRAGEDVLRAHPEVSTFLLDDGFQHRQLARDVDLVLVNAAEPFGFGRVLPRGTLREPLGGLRRASAFLLTRCDQASEAALADVRQTLRAHNPAAPIFACDHAAAGFRDAEGNVVGDPGDAGGDALRNRRWFAFCGIGDPASFVRQLTTLAGGAAPSGSRAFADHHAYTDADVRSLAASAVERGADVW